MLTLNNTELKEACENFHPIYVIKNKKNKKMV